MTWALIEDEERSAHARNQANEVEQTLSPFTT
jgi:hypothetical protein